MSGEEGCQFPWPDGRGLCGGVEGHLVHRIVVPLGYIDGMPFHAYVPPSPEGRKEGGA